MLTFIIVTILISSVIFYRVNPILYWLLCQLTLTTHSHIVNLIWVTQILLIYILYSRYVHTPHNYHSDQSSYVLQNESKFIFIAISAHFYHVFAYCQLYTSCTNISDIYITLQVCLHSQLLLFCQVFINNKK